MLKKCLVVGIILLFICVSVTSSISGYVGKTDQTAKEIPTNFSLSNDYVHAHWKFDTGSGDTTYDSSGHDYDGTIHGASWTTDTPSGDDYALDFDGANDYVDLDAHSEDLGFNKTDDLIFLFYFKSTSTDTCMIYSTSASWGTNPECHIFLDNGNLAFKIEVTSCGFTLYSNGTYNNGSWHHAEITFNGNSCNPTVEIHIDDDPIDNITEWVCPFSNDEFTKVKIGRRSHNETNYFDGKIDDFKIIKYPGGNQQGPPEIDGPTSGSPGEELEYTFVTNDPEGDDIYLYIDWDDGDEGWSGPYTSGEEVIIKHKWDVDGLYQIKAKSKDIWGISVWSYHEIAIGNVPPEPPIINGSNNGDSGDILDFTFNSTDFEGEDIYYYIEWGDGTNTTWLGPYESSEEVDVSHRWDSKGDYEIRAKARDINNAESNWSIFQIRIDNEAPDGPIITGPTKGIFREEYWYNFSLSDYEDDQMYLRIDWGSGTLGPWQGPYDSDTIVNFSHIWDKRGTYTIGAQAMDIYDDVSDWGTLEVTMPKNKPFNYFYNVLNWLFERFPNAFPILRYMVGL